MELGSSLEMRRVIYIMGAMSKKINIPPLGGARSGIEGNYGRRNFAGQRTRPKGSNLRR